MKNKKEVRSIIFNNIKKLDVNIISNVIVKKIKQDINYQNAKNVALYYPMNHEANLLELLKDNKTFLFPKIIKKRIMEFIVINENTKWKINKFGINEPINGKILREEIDLFLISSLAKNNENVRLGHGGGYYDKYFENDFKTIKIGILLEENIVDFKTNNYDIKLDYYISGKE